MNLLLTFIYLAETLINEIHIMSYLLLKKFTKTFIIKLTLGLFLRYYNLGDFHPDILIEAILINPLSARAFFWVFF